MNRRRRMLSSSSVGKKESHCSTKLCTPVWFSIDSKGHLQARKKGKAEKLRENCRKLRKIAENCGPQFPPPANWLLKGGQKWPNHICTHTLHVCRTPMSAHITSPPVCPYMGVSVHETLQRAV